MKIAGRITKSRQSLLVCAVVGLVGCGSRPAPEAPTNKPTPTATLDTACSATPFNADTPAVVLFERDPWLMAVGSDFPTIAIWLDGSVVFIRENGKQTETLQASIGAENAERIANSVATQMRDVPAHSSVSNTTDRRTVEIVVRDGSVWRVGDVYGLTRNGPPIPTEGVPCPPGSRRRLCGFVERPEKTPTEPAGFFAAYRTLLDARPNSGVPFTPADIKVLFWGFDDARGTPVPWPNELPPPPKDAVPAERKPFDPVAYEFVIPSSAAPALERLLQTAYAKDPPRGIAFNGHKWTVEPLRRYRGQQAIDRLVHCTHTR
jgi:hypothetical protein